RIRKVIGTGGEGSGHDDGGLDVPPCQFARVADRHRIHACFRREVWRKVWWRAASRAAASDPDDQPPSLPAENGKRGPVYALRAHNVDVIKFGDLLRCKGFRWSKNHVPGVVNNDIETARLIENLPDRPVGGFLRAHVQFDCTKVNAVLSGKLASGFNLVRVAS